MRLSPDQIVYWQGEIIILNATLVFTWLIMGLMVLISGWITYQMKSSSQVSKVENFLEIIVQGILQQIQEIAPQESPMTFLPFVGTLFLFIATSNLLTIIPGYEPPTGSLSTTAALAFCVLIAVPVYGICKQGLWGYLKTYLQPQPFMLPFNIISEISRTVALAVRLFANIASGSMIAAVLLALVPLLFPVFMQVLGLLVGVIQAYIFSVMAMVYIASGMAVEAERDTELRSKNSS